MRLADYPLSRERHPGRNRTHLVTLIDETGSTLASFISAVSVPIGWVNWTMARVLALS
jgi:hypothetical protein